MITFARHRVVFGFQQMRVSWLSICLLSLTLLPVIPLTSSSAFADEQDVYFSVVMDPYPPTWRRGIPRYQAILHRHQGENDRVVGRIVDLSSIASSSGVLVLGSSIGPRLVIYQKIGAQGFFHISSASGQRSMPVEAASDSGVIHLVPGSNRITYISSAGDVYEVLPNSESVMHDRALDGAELVLNLVLESREISRLIAPYLTTPAFRGSGGGIGTFQFAQRISSDEFVLVSERALVRVRFSPDRATPSLVGTPITIQSSLASNGIRHGRTQETLFMANEHFVWIGVRSSASSGASVSATGDYEFFRWSLAAPAASPLLFSNVRSASLLPLQGDLGELSMIDADHRIVTLVPDATQVSGYRIDPGFPSRPGEIHLQTRHGANSLLKGVFYPASLRIPGMGETGIPPIVPESIRPAVAAQVRREFEFHFENACDPNTGGPRSWSSGHDEELGVETVARILNQDPIGAPSSLARGTRLREAVAEAIDAHPDRFVFEGARLEVSRLAGRITFSRTGDAYGRVSLDALVTSTVTPPCGAALKRHFPGNSVP